MTEKKALAKVRRYGEMETAPGGRDGCVDCGVLGLVVEMVG